MPMAAGNMIAPLTPCNARAVTSHASARSPAGASPHSSDVTPKPAMPIMTIRWCPNTSARRPPSRKNAAVASRYALTAHWMPSWVSPS
jgi:hypothetical protein